MSSGTGPTEEQLLGGVVSKTAGYIQTVYAAVLFRQPEAAEMQKHLNAILRDRLSLMDFFDAVVNSDERRTSVATKLKYKSPFLESSTNHDFCIDPKFIAAMEAATGDFEKEYGTHPTWNFHVLLWVASQAMSLPGDLVQCGVFNGADAAAIASYTNLAAYPEKKFYLLDTFVGVPEEQWSPTELTKGANSAQWLYKQVGDRYPAVVARFKTVPNVRVIRGKVPDTLDQVDSAAIAALFLDMNCAFPETAAMEFFWDRIVPGGIIFSDDYGHSRGGLDFYESKIGFDRFAAKVGLEPLSLPTGQGLIVKTCR